MTSPRPRSTQRWALPGWSFAPSGSKTIGRPSTKPPPSTPRAETTALPERRAAGDTRPAALGSQSLETYSALLEAVPDALIIVDRDGRIVLVNSHTERLFGWRRAELLGQPIEMLVPERFQARHVHYRDGYLAEPRVRPMGADLELFGRHKDGHEIPVEISLSPLATETGPPNSGGKSTSMAGPTVTTRSPVNETAFGSRVAM